jgi:ComF family protein
MSIALSHAAAGPGPARATAASLYRASRRGAARALGLLQHALPQACALCARPCGDALLCADCRDALPRLGPACPVCALPAAGGEVCGACLARPPPFAATVAAWAYAFPADRLLQGLKYGRRIALAGPLADALASAVASRGGCVPDAVIALPLAPARQRERGFNQAAEIARSVAHALSVPLATGLARVREAPPQAALSWRARARNVRDAFRGDRALAGARVAIVDDVMTTGATIAAAARAARRAGATEVVAWVVARTLPPRAPP